jgi:Contractile injection system tube protein/LysM domain
MLLTLIKAQVQRLKPDGTLDGAPFPVQFNPTEYSLSKGAQIAEIAMPGLDQPVLQFVRGQTETMNVDLFFDTTDQGTGPDATAVTTKTDKFYELIKIDRVTHAPPILRFMWGQDGFAGANFDGNWSSQARTNGFQCIVENVKQRFTLFSSQGIPLRAVLSVTLREYYSLEDQIQRINFNSPDHTHTHVVQRGDTLASIAAKKYDDPRLWRAIADQNGLTDPSDLQPGMVLEVPPIR